ncbi:MAG: 1-deoxy-D-xylulose-5-phosphate reductoisomerase [Acidobacteriota bacterium]
MDLYPERLRVVALAARRNIRELEEQVVRYRPDLVAVYDPEAAAVLRRRFPELRVVEGESGLAEAACHPAADVVVAATVGAVGLVPVFRALQAGKRIALANKETLVMAGDLLMPLAREGPAEIVPVDSEHSALHQCLRAARRDEVRRLVLTASGGPFLGFSRERLARVTVEEALAHPTWSMGPKVTVDSATLMNKGLEVIEAHHLFAFPPRSIEVVIHPQSVVHSIVELVDGSHIAQLGITDMRSCLLYAIAYPERWETRLPRLDLSRVGELRFFEPDMDTFRCLRLAYQALEAGGTAPAILNAANEVAVELFLGRRLSFTRIPELIEETLSRETSVPAGDLETVLEADRRARETARRLAQRLD